MVNEVKRPKYVPKRYEWWPGEKVDAVGFTVREASQADLFVLQRAFRVPIRALSRWINYHGYNVWTITRNYRNPVAAIAARHADGESKVLRYWYHADAYASNWMTTLAALAQCEVPEWPIVWPARLDDDRMIRDLVSAGFTRSDADDDAATVLLTRKALLRK